MGKLFLAWLEIEITTSDGCVSKKSLPVLGQVNFLSLGLGQPHFFWVWIISSKNNKFFNFCLRVKKSLKINQMISIWIYFIGIFKPLNVRICLLDLINNDVMGKSLM